MSSITPPGQPKTGPGGRDYRHAGVFARKFGTGAGAAWLFTPADPVPETAPVIVFVHGWSAIDPAPYRAWIDHIVRRGHIVIFPVYQNLIFNVGRAVARTAIRSTAEALAHLEQGPVYPDLDRFAVVGHSLGGAISLNLAVDGPAAGLPPCKAFMIMQPGAAPWFPLADLEKLSPDLRLIVLVGDADEIAGDRMAREIWARLGQIPPDRKAFVVLQSDAHGAPPLVADHISVCAPVLPEGVTQQPFLKWTMSVDALDFFGYWKLLDALTACAFEGGYCAWCAAGAPEHQFMGRWSDGTPVRPILNE